MILRHYRHTTTMKRDIAKLVRDGLYAEALSLYSNLHSRSFKPTKFTFPPLFKATVKLNALRQGQVLHTHLMKTGFQADSYAATALTHMYLIFGISDNALKLFDENPQPRIASLNAAISGFSYTGDFKDALRVFKLVGTNCVRPDSVTIASTLTACGNAVEGLQVHCWAVKIGVEADIYAATSLLTMYYTNADVASASKMFVRIQHKNTVCCNAFVTGLLQNGDALKVLDVFKEMEEKPNSVTLVSVLSACSELKYSKFGRQVHGFIARSVMDLDTMVGTALVDMYSKCGFWHSAFDVFKELNGRRSLITWNSVISGLLLNDQCEIAVGLFAQLESEGFKPDSSTWNSMISGFSNLGKDYEAFLFFRKMQSAGETPNLKCITSLLPACSSIMALGCGKGIHGHVIRKIINHDDFIATGLIDMYMKCGKPFWGKRVFDQYEIKPRDPAIWNAMISGYGRNGENEAAFKIFNQMKKEKISPSSATFNCILSVCSHCGQVEKGWEVFRSISEDYGLKPTSEHFSCMIDILGRSGRIEEARELLQKIPEPSTSVLAILLSAAKYYPNSILGEEMANMLSELEPENPAPFVALSNIYAGQDRWKDAEEIRQSISQRKLKKIPGLSSIGPI